MTKDQTLSLFDYFYAFFLKKDSQIELERAKCKQTCYSFQNKQ